MSFPKTLKAAKADAIDLIAAGDTAKDGGFLVSEDQINSIESTLADNETQIANLTTECDNANNALKVAKDATTEANTRLTNANTRISNLEAEVATLKGKPAADFSITKSGDDPPPVLSGKTTGKDKYRTKWDVEAEAYR